MKIIAQASFHTIFFRFDSPVKLRGRSPVRELKERSLHHIKYENNENQNRRKMNKEGGILLHKLRVRLVSTGAPKIPITSNVKGP